MTHFTYVIRDRWGIAIYVGCTANVGQRMRNHQYKPWFKKWAATTEVTPHRNYYAGRLAEGDLIRKLHPVFNKRRMTKQDEGYRYSVLGVRAITDEKPDDAIQFLGEYMAEEAVAPILALVASPSGGEA